jgi:bifunctional enzyme CysN/CysC
MDQVAFDEAAYRRIVADYESFAQRLEFHDLAFLPACAVGGDNVTRRSDRTPWYDGPHLLQYLESLHVTAWRNLIDFRFPVQSVVRPTPDFRGFAGRIASGTIRPGEEVTVLPTAKTTRVKSIESHDGRLDEAFAPQSVVLTLTDEIDVSRGCMLARPRNLPESATGIDATLCWMDAAPLRPGATYLLKHTTQTVKAFVSKVVSRFDVDTLHRRDAPTLELNDLGRVEIQTTLPLFFDAYKSNRATGSFILIDPETNATAAAGMIRGRAGERLEPGEARRGRRRSANTVAHPPNIGQEAREVRNRHRAAIVWLTGLSGSGKSTIGKMLERALFERGCQTVLLDGDQLRQGLCGDLGFSPEDRSENIRRAGEVARLFFESGHIVVCTFISPIAKDRAFVRSLVPAGRFWEIYVDCPVEVCAARDPSGLYARAMEGEIRQFTGISSAYEPPAAPELIVDTVHVDPGTIVGKIVGRLADAGIA